LNHGIYKVLPHTPIGIAKSTIITSLDDNITYSSVLDLCVYKWDQFWADIQTENKRKNRSIWRLSCPRYSRPAVGHTCLLYLRIYIEGSKFSSSTHIHTSVEFRPDQWTWESMGIFRLNWKSKPAQQFKRNKNTAKTTIL